MTAYRISEVAHRTGFSPATLRYYEALGIVPPPDRSQGGYRVYDDRAVARLTFVGRARQLGLSLDEVGDLAELWDGDECGAVQGTMAAFVADKLAETRSRIEELVALAEQLEAAAGRLAEVPHAGPCNETCACNAETAAPSGNPPNLSRRRRDVPIACTLDPNLLTERLSDWNAVANRAVGKETLDTGVRLRFAPEDGLAADLAALAEAEHRCCAFLDFAIGINADAITLDVRAPADAGPVVAQLFGLAT
jgi:DNA-binding transcriptional MerR regulator